MIRALAIKELRETAWIWLLAAAWLFVVAMDAMRIPLLPEYVRNFAMPRYRPEAQIPFLGGEIANGIAMGMGLFAIALGIRQSAGESWTGTYPLILHLPMARQRLFGVKLVVGLALVWGVGAAALGAICWWAATPGTHGSPFEWGMTAETWRVWFSMSVVYLGAFATGLWPTGWFGTRLFPLVTACMTTVAILSAASLEVLPTYAFVIAVVLAAAAYGVVIGHQSAVRDFS